MIGRLDFVGSSDLVSYQSPFWSRHATYSLSWWLVKEHFPDRFGLFLKYVHYVHLVLLPRLLVVHRDAFVFTPLLTCLVQMAVKFSVQCKQRTYLVALNL